MWTGDSRHMEQREEQNALPLRDAQIAGLTPALEN
jgi:hypothetical protein